MVQKAHTIFSRSNEPTIESRVDLDLICLSPTDLNNRLYTYIGYMNDNTAEPISHYTHDTVMFGYENLPLGDYHIEVHTPRIPLWVSNDDYANLTPIVWYNNEDNQLVYDMPILRSGSILWAKVPSLEHDNFHPTRVTYCGRTIYLNCNKVQENPLLVYFFDLYGLPQCISLNRNEYKLNYQTLGSYRSYNDGLNHEYHKQANYTMTITDSGFNKELIPLLNGFTLSEGYWCESVYTHDLVSCALTSVNTSIAKKENKVQVVGTLEIRPTDALKIEPNWYDNN